MLVLIYSFFEKEDWKEDIMILKKEKFYYVDSLLSLS